MKVLTIILMIWLAVLGIYWQLMARDASTPPLNNSATLDILLDGPDLFIDFDVAAVELMGFGHAPQNTQEHTALVEAHRLLDSGAMVMPSADAKCSLTESFATVGHGYDDLCASDSPLPTTFSKGSANSNPQTPLSWPRISEQAEISARWAWTCEQPANLSTLRVHLFEGFSHLQSLFVNTDGTSAIPASQQVWKPDGMNAIITLDSTEQAEHAQTSSAYSGS